MIYRGIFIVLVFSLSTQTVVAKTEPNEITRSTCSQPVVSAPPAPALKNSELGPDALTIVADKVYGKQLERLEFQGNVQVAQGERQLSASQAILDRKTNQLKAVGGVQYQDDAISVEAEGLLSMADEHKVELHQSQYQMRADTSRGKAQKLEVHQKDQSLILRDGTFTTCPEGDDSWLLSAGKIELDSQSEWGTAHNSTILIAGVPVLWVPYMSFPLTDKRKSGLLFPSIGNSTDNGLDLAQPYYWNIRENMDATFTPRYMSNRGTQLATEFRHLSDHQYNQLNLEYLPSDKELTGIQERYMAYWLHQGKFGPHWRSQIEFTHVSDDNYFNDLGGLDGPNNDSRLERTAELSYLSELLDVRFSLSDFEVFGDNEEVYQQLPRIMMSYRLPHFSNQFDGGLKAEATHFSHPNPTQASAVRIHLEPNLAYDWLSPAASFSAEAKLYQTFYRQDDPDLQLDEFVSRTIPSVRLFGQLNFERQTSFFGLPFTQTLEPKAQYLLTRYENQDDIGSYDTIRMRDGVHGLFRDRRFSGYDRIADTNQVTLGVTTRLLNASNKEALRLSLGQILYLSDSELIKDITDQQGDEASAFAMTLDTFMGDYNLHAEYQYSFERNMAETSNLLLNYAPESRKLVQLSYHYSPEPLNFDPQLNSNTNSREINQVGAVLSWPINENLQFVGSHYRDLELNRSIESLAGLQYQSCCWAVRVVYQRNINTNFPDEHGNLVDREAFDAGINIQFEIKGFGGSSDLSGHKAMIDKSLFGYRRNYYLNN